MNLPISFLNGKLVTFLKEDNSSLGLADGKMGHCIYFYYLSSTHKNYRVVADHILDDILRNINTINSIDVKSGLAGIGLGINFLVKNNYVKGNANVILKDIDDIIFRNLFSFKCNNKKDSLFLVHILFYLCVRLKNQKQGGEDEYLFRELIIQTVDNLYENIGLNFYEEPLAYDIDYFLPQFLFVLSEIFSFDFYNYRLIRIIEELSYKVLSTLPLLHCNRLYLLWGMNALNKKIVNKDWEKHIQLINSQIDIDIILHQELGDKNIFFSDGFASICLMSLNLTDKFPEIFNNKNVILSKIVESKMWNSLVSEPQCFEKYNGLYNGYCGTVLLIETIKKNHI